MISEIFLNSYVARKAIRKTEVQFHLQNLYLNLFISKNSCWQSSCLLRCKMHTVGSHLMHDLRSVLFTVTVYIKIKKSAGMICENVSVNWWSLSNCPNSDTALLKTKSQTTVNSNFILFSSWTTDMSRKIMINVFYENIWSSSFHESGHFWMGYFIYQVHLPCSSWRRNLWEHWVIIMLQRLSEMLAVTVWREEPIDWQVIKFRQRRDSRRCKALNFREQFASRKSCQRVVEE